MNGQARIVRGLGATLAMTALMAVLALAWALRPVLPPLPQSFSAPLPSVTISAMLQLAAWIVFVLLDLVLIRKVFECAIRREATRMELRLRHAFAPGERPSLQGRSDWKAFAAPLPLPVLRLPARLEPIERDPRSVRLHEHGAHEMSASVDVAMIDAASERRGVLLLGPLELTGCKKKQPRRQATAELVAYLAVRKRSATRDELLEALWPGDDPRRSTARFYQAVSEARKLLGDAFQRDRDTYALDREQLRIDLDDLNQACSDAEASTGQDQRAFLERGLALFRGQPLSGIESLWVDSEAQRLCAVEIDLLERIGFFRLQAGEAIGALEAAERARVLDPSKEQPVQLAMQAEAVLGRREAVADRYERLRRELNERFGLEPSHDTKLLYRRLLSQEERTQAFAQ